MTTPPEPATSAIDLDAEIARWRRHVARHDVVGDSDGDELEDHLRSQVADLVRVGLAPDEAFWVAVKRMGSVNLLAGEFARQHSDRLWKQLVTDAESPRTGRRGPGTLWRALALAAGAAAAIKLPELAGVSFTDDAMGYARNLSLFCLPFLAGYFAWTRRLGVRIAAVVVGLFVVGALAANLPPFSQASATGGLVALALPALLWGGVGLAYAGDEWRSVDRRMDFIRFTGEWAIYYTLIALGGGVLIVLTQGAFYAVGVDVLEFLSRWVVPCGAMGAVVVAGHLVEAKKSVIENMAPVLTRVFTPLATVMILVLLAVTAWAGPGVDTGRELLIVSDLILVLVLGLLLYSWSARPASQPPGWFEWLQLVLVSSAIAVDALGLAAMVTRISTWGPSPNKVAALGLNLVLLVNLAWSAWLVAGFLRRRRPFLAIERWQTGYLPVFSAWAAVVVLVFPPLFGFA